MTLWKSNVPHNEPLAVMEWKVNHYFNRAVHQQNRQEHLQDVQWLCLEIAAIRKLGFHWLRGIAGKSAKSERANLRQNPRREA